jgi:hypothetical protein
MTYRHLRKTFRHARHLRRRNHIPLLPAAAVVGAATMVALSLGGQLSDAPLIERADGTAILDLSAAGGQDTALSQPPDVLPTAEARAGGTGPVHAPARSAPRATTAAPKRSAAPSAAAKAPAKKAPAPPAQKVLKYDYELQINGYYCGPAATRIAVTARGHDLSQDNLAGQLGTTVNGTNSAFDIARVLNAVDKTSFYNATSIPAKPATPQQMDQLQADVVHAVSNGYPVVMNIVGTGFDVNGNSYSYGGGHYITVVGYADQGRQVKIADPANSVGDGTYWMTTINLATWAGERGYAS